MKVLFNETNYSANQIENAKMAMSDCLKSGWVVTGPETNRAEEYCASLVGAEYAVGFGIAPFFPVAAALKYYFKLKGIMTPRVLVQATAWPEHIACFHAFGFQVELSDITCAVGGYPNFDLTALLTLASPHVVFTADVHGACTQDIEHIASRCKGLDILLVHDVSYGFFAQNIDGFTRQYGDIVTMSLNPGKLVTGLNGGMALTDNIDIYELMKMARLDGLEQPAKNCIIPVGDWRMLEIQANILYHCLLGVQDQIEERIRIANKYEEAIKENPKLEPLMIRDQTMFTGLDRFTLRIPGNKQELRDELNRLGIQSVPLTYDHPASWHSIADDVVVGGKYTPVADEWCETHILIPLHNKLTRDEVDFVCETLQRIDVWK